MNAYKAIDSDCFYKAVESFSKTANIPAEAAAVFLLQMAFKEAQSLAHKNSRWHTEIYPLLKTIILTFALDIVTMDDDQINSRSLEQTFMN